MTMSNTITVTLRVNDILLIIGAARLFLSGSLENKQLRCAVDRVTNAVADSVARATSAPPTD